MLASSTDIRILLIFAVANPKQQSVHIHNSAQLLISFHNLKSKESPVKQKHLQEPVKN